MGYNYWCWQSTLQNNLFLLSREFNRNLFFTQQAQIRPHNITRRCANYWRLWLKLQILLTKPVESFYSSPVVLRHDSVLLIILIFLKLDLCNTLAKLKNVCNFTKYNCLSVACVRCKSNHNNNELKVTL